MKKIITSTFLMICLFFLVSCNKKNSNSITLMVPAWGVPTETMLNNFQAESGIKVNIDSVSWDDIKNKVAIAATGKKAAADVIEVDWSWIGEFKSAGWLEPLSLDEKTIKDIPSLSTFTINNKILAVPYANDFRTAYYNTELYKKADLNPPKTWNELEKQMNYFKDKKILAYPYTLPLNATEGTTTALIWITFLRDGKVFNDNGSLNKENILTTLNFINNCVQNKLINPINLNMKDIDTYRQLLSGDSAYMIGPTSFISRAYDKTQSQVIGDIQIVLPPGEKTTAKQTMALTEALGVSSFSKNKEAAQKFVKWYTSKKIQKELYNNLNTIPTRTSVLNDLIVNGDIKNAGALMETAKLVKSPFPNGVPDYYGEMSKTISNAINKMASGEITPNAAFDEMNTKINNLIKNN
ncbi:extracellular solute-binding protein [uncultured Cetobacterium sp.]|uniref:sugar ABC transporter substrate-binding protein n=1 Tax=uncultured Cetobacterium sp. TaxID=527638 RepID=UPI00260C6732|nr:extracellular solute-binding protein [uncultured Cetobacterium sp.]